MNVCIDSFVISTELLLLTMSENIWRMCFRFVCMQNDLDEWFIDNNNILFYRNLFD